MLKQTNFKFPIKGGKVEENKPRDVVLCRSGAEPLITGVFQSQGQAEQAGLVFPNPVRVNYYAINWIALDLT